MKSNNTQIKIVVIIPTYNEAENIEKTIRVVFNSFPKLKDYEYDILIVDGNSPDGTSNIVRHLISSYNNLHLLVEKQKNGLGAAYLSGMDYSFNTLGASHVIQFDADLSHDPHELKNFIDYLTKGYDVVLGTRYRNGGSIPKNWGWHRKFLSKFGNLFVRLVFLNNSISDWTGGYGAYSKKVYEDSKKSISRHKGYTFQISLHKAALDSKAKIAEVPFTFKDRELGKSKMGSEYIVNAMYFVVKTRITEILFSRFLKVCIVGTIGATIQFLGFRFFRTYVPYDLLSHNLSIELAVLSNFVLNNQYSFKSHKIKSGLLTFIKTFVKFNFVSMGSIVVQNIVMRVGLFVFGENIPHIKDYLNISGILFGLVFNYYFYSRFIWKSKKIR